MNEKKLFLLISLVAALVSCRLEPSAPDRLHGIPESARWAGGVDGGSWIECLVDDEAGANWCTVWDDQTGRIVARTHFVVRGEGGAAPEDQLTFEGFNGIYIVLTNGVWLEPLDYHRDPNRDPWKPIAIDPPS